MEFNIRNNLICFGKNNPKRRGEKIIFIGVIADKKEENDLEKMLKMQIESIGLKSTIIRINKKSIENIKNIRIELVIMNKNIEEESMQELEKILRTAKYFIVNSDVIQMEKIPRTNSTVITYGFGNKCTVTASSTEEENVMVCLQRNICGIKNTRIEPQEIKMKKGLNTGNYYLEMAVATIKLLY